MKALERRPPVRRWIFAAIAAWLAAAGLPTIGFWLVAGGGSAGAIVLGVVWTVVLGLPLALPGLLVLAAVAWFGFKKLRLWPVWGWAGLGLAIGAVCIAPLLFAGSTANENAHNPLVWGALAGGAISGAVFRFALPP